MSREQVTFEEIKDAANSLLEFLQFEGEYHALICKSVKVKLLAVVAGTEQRRKHKGRLCQDARSQQQLSGKYLIKSTKSQWQPP